MSKSSLVLIDWKPSVVPGLCFLSIETEQPLAVYGKILDLHADGYLWAFCYHYLCSTGEESKIHNSDLTLPLSAEQFRLAKNLGWPSHEYGLTQILSVPAS